MRTVDVLSKLSEEVLSREPSNVSGYDRSLDALLNSKAVKESILDYVENQEDSFTVDNSGFLFHKAFRSHSIIKDQDLSLAIWILIGKSELFWTVVKEIQKEESGMNFIHINITDSDTHANVKDGKVTSTDDLNNHNYC